MSVSLATHLDIFPRPRRVQKLGGRFGLPANAALVVKGGDSSARKLATRIVFEAAQDRGLRWKPLRLPDKKRAPVEINLKSETGTRQSYRLVITPDGVTLVASDADGFRYGAMSLAQLISTGARSVQAMTIEDSPDFPVRGVMLDISRDKVPTMSELEKLVTLLAQWKINQFQLYMENTFAYRRHEIVWRDASPMTAAEIRALDALCRRNGIDLVPNQNSFGHMERWLRRKPYRHLAETHMPWRTPWGSIRTQSATLNPTDPRSLQLMSGLYDELLPNFSSELFNIGCDETWELGQGRSLAACTRRGVGRVYLDYLLSLHREVSRRKRRTMFWADIILQYPKLIQHLPKKAVALIWGYEADHPFRKQCRDVARAGLSFYVCPGTSSWCSFSGRTHNSTANLIAASRAGLAAGADGYLITDWGDFGHRQYAPVSYGPFARGAALAWCLRANGKVDVAMEVSRRVLGDGSGRSGRWWHGIGDVYRASGKNLKNRTILFSLMQTPLEKIPRECPVSAGAIRGMQKALRKLESELPRTRPTGKDGALVKQEMAATLAVLRHACKRAELANQLERFRPSRAQLKSLAADMRGIIRTHRRLWLARNRPGGLESSCRYYSKLIEEYESMMDVAGIRQ